MAFAEQCSCLMLFIRNIFLDIVNTCHSFGHHFSKGVDHCHSGNKVGNFIFFTEYLYVVIVQLLFALLILQFAHGAKLDRPGRK
jgi:hypothetical protein